MGIGKYKEFSHRLIEIMKLRGHIASRSPSGICIQTLSKFAGVSEQICRRYIRGDALPDYARILNIARELNVTAGWLLFGEQERSESHQTQLIDDDLLHYILKKSHHLYREETGNTDDYADFVLGLIRDVRQIDTSKENLEKIINLAIDSISSYEEKYRKMSCNK
ncbi:helix-turn-helix domain-containing protein [Legionella cardiaca]|uniref:Helix-turn-helix domain-containing protein n=1 Tax=Legionella cardiaca TaxID=1071983 RepID=A0ABY8ARU9_9GAMM|nr:helix-turn-helix domain-containing protein [Legionella cardiaca]WED43243.1 helix-turn-helix domain-containing protein [Legionella cardiaca]